ncbi:hypothetical protein GCM10029963_70970 [Micromonospora andamanensis]
MTSDPLLCYVHINKNAGNSIIEALLNNYPGRFRQYLVSGRKSNGGRGPKPSTVRTMTCGRSSRRSSRASTATMR